MPKKKSKKVKQTGYVSRDDLHGPSGTSSGVTHAGERVPRKSRPGLVGGADQTVDPVKATAQAEPTGFGPSYVGEGIDQVQPVARKLNPVERARQANNAARDQRSALGRGKPSVVTTD